MTRCQHTSSAPIVLLILFGITQQLFATIPLVKGGQSNDDVNVSSPPGLAKLFSSQLEGGQVRVNKEPTPTQMLPEEEDELFKDVDPKTLAAVLLEALNQPGEAKKSNRAEVEENNRGSEGEEKGQEELALLGSDRDRDRKQELELVMAAAAAEGKEEQEREEEERKRAEEEEEQLTEKVKSRTTSQAMPVKEQPDKETAKEQETREEEHQEPGGEEEQLSPQEVKNLQAMLEELQSYSTANKRDRDSGGQRESRGSFQDMDNFHFGNEIKPKPKGYQLALSKKKLKWQEEEEKKKNRPLYRGGNFMDDFDDSIKGQNEEDKEDEEDEEVLSPEEEEARAKAEQEEVRRQAAEAQRAKAEEERLADIASDMLLQYMVKQDGKKYTDQSKKTSQGNNAAEDKRSEEEENNDDDDDDDDIDPQTIDKLIEISSKLHLPADDVVDIISDVEKKKKKDAPLPAPAPAPRNPAPKLSSSLTSPSKTWFKDKAVVTQSKQDFWPKLQKQFRTYPTYSFVQKPYRGYFPIYIPPPKPRPQYYAKPTFSFGDVLGNSLGLDYDFGFPPKRRYRPWAQPRSRNPPPLRRNLYFSNYILPHPRTFKPVPVPKPRSPPRRRPSYYYSPPAPMVPRNEDYFDPVGQQQDNDEELENFIEKVLLKHPRMFQ
ncbi:hypothetical protein COCON_G00045300 [Conger conger]|uniref:Uncharacterized protein n=1 Tax=Conger conger TaxID=82655 RepID=A0A9Q1DUK1_CONCO|nr:neurosecretory protein VGF [Conger conger]KAJ8282011.1 hypothetical protein COCON_G00045300 [Conger conger]